jgi:hypothetical protein
MDMVSGKRSQEKSKKSTSAAEKRNNLPLLLRGGCSHIMSVFDCSSRLFVKRLPNRTALVGARELASYSKTLTIAREILAYSSAVRLVISMTRHISSTTCDCDMPSTAGKTRMPRYGCPVPKRTVSVTAQCERIAPSITTGLNFLTFPSAMISSSHAMYFQAFSIVGCGSNKSFVA